MSSLVRVFTKKGQKITLDLEDYLQVMNRTLQVSSHGYARVTYRQVQYYIHRLILNPSPQEEVDHINGDRLDNRKSNLRCCSGAENRRNQRKRPKSKHGHLKYKGVYKKGSKWEARLGKKYLGAFDSAEEAALIYNRYALSEYGSFANLNEVDSG